MEGKKIRSEGKGLIAFSEVFRVLGRGLRGGGIFVKVAKENRRGEKGGGL